MNEYGAAVQWYWCQHILAKVCPLRRCPPLDWPAISPRPVQWRESADYPSEPRHVHLLVFMKGISLMLLWNKSDWAFVILWWEALYSIHRFNCQLVWWSQNDPLQARYPFCVLFFLCCVVSALLNIGPSCYCTRTSSVRLVNKQIL